MVGPSGMFLNTPQLGQAAESLSREALTPPREESVWSPVPNCSPDEFLFPHYTGCPLPFPEGSKELVQTPSLPWPSAPGNSSCSRMDEAPATAKVREQNDRDKRNVLSRTGTDTGSSYHAQTKEEYFPDFSSVCHVSPLVSQGIFLLFCAIRVFCDLI